MVVICCQLDIAWHDREANYRNVRALLAGDPPTAGSLIVLPETFATGFSMDVAAVGEGGDNKPTETFLAELATEHGATVLGGVVTAAGDGRGSNQAVAFGPDGNEVARFTKLHSFSPAGEHEHYTPGRDVVCFDCNGLTVAPLICYDLRFPEVFRLAAARGAQAFVVIANWPAVRQAHWRALLIARAIENQSYVIGVNRCGNDPNHDYAGGSVILDPMGNVLVEAGSDQCLLSTDLSLETVTTARERFPARKDIRGDL